jgi:hypothetical protein
MRKLLLVLILVVVGLSGCYMRGHDDVSRRDRDHREDNGRQNNHKSDGGNEHSDRDK